MLLDVFILRAQTVLLPNEQALYQSPASPLLQCSRMLLGYQRHHLLGDGLTNEPPVGGGVLLAEDQARGRGYVEKAVLSLLVGLLCALENGEQEETQLGRVSAVASDERLVCVRLVRVTEQSNLVNAADVSFKELRGDPEYVLDRPWFLFVEHGEVDRHDPIPTSKAFRGV